MNGLADVFQSLNGLRDEGLIEAYAIGGGMAALFYAETTRTYDIDVFALIPGSGFLIDLSAIYEWAKKNGFETHQEHILIHGVPVQFLVARDGLETEAITNAQIIDYKGVEVRVMQPQYLAVIYVLAGSSKRRERARALFEAGAVDKTKLDALLHRFGLQDEWQSKGGADVAGIAE
ncbi:MAG TPA: hypothetical protein VGB77_03660 [Abditibacteriaceae bacterium]|jgi:hypothetical protein